MNSFLAWSISHLVPKIFWVLTNANEIHVLYLHVIALRIDDVSVHVCPHSPFILAFQTIENAHLKSLDN